MSHGATLRAPEATAAPALPGAAHISTEETGTIDPALQADLRREFFRSAGLAARYGVSCEEVLSHLARAGLQVAARPQRVLAHMGDVILAVACVRGSATAWNDLLNQNAWVLDRACAEGLGAGAGLAFARRFWSDLKAATTGRAAHLPEERCRTRLQCYAGLRPLRTWLADRLFGGMASAAWGRAWAILDTPGDRKSVV